MISPQISTQIPCCVVPPAPRAQVGDCPPGKVHEWQIEAEHRHEHLLREVEPPMACDPIFESVQALLFCDPVTKEST